MNADVLPFRATPKVQTDQRSFENAVIRLLKQKPFYGHLMLRIKRHFVDGNSPLGLTVNNGTPTLNINLSRFKSYPAAEQQALLEHVIKHLLHLHPVRGRGWHPNVWDLATDFAINPLIEGMPKTAPYPEKIQLEPGLAAEEYARILKAKFDLGTLSGDGLGRSESSREGLEGRASGPSSSTAKAGLPVDDHRVWQESESTPECLADQVVRDMVQEAYRKSHGDVPDDVAGLVDWLLAPPEIPWQQVLRQFVGTAGRIGRRNTWQRQHRRFQHDNPGIQKRRQLNLLVAIDVSESTDEAPLREAFARELIHIARGRDSRMTVLYAHSRIRKINHFNSRNVVGEVVHGGGFTDLRPVFEFAKKMVPKPAAVIYLTDGYGPAPETMDFPTLWVLTPEGKRPVDWGVELKLSQIGGSSKKAEPVCY